MQGQEVDGGTVRDLIAVTHMPDVGSSKKTVLLPPQNAIATLSFRFIPPLRFFAKV